jgi:hypothetical protein
MYLRVIPQAESGAFSEGTGKRPQFAASARYSLPEAEQSLPPSLGLFTDYGAS